MTDPENYKNLKKQINSIFPYFDTKALDAARFFYGTKDPQVQFHEGTITLNECLDLYYPDNEEAFASLPCRMPAASFPKEAETRPCPILPGSCSSVWVKRKRHGRSFWEKARVLCTTPGTARARYHLAQRCTVLPEDLPE